MLFRDNYILSDHKDKTEVICDVIAFSKLIKIARLVKYMYEQLRIINKSMWFII